jgi:hypothetical protein
MALSDVLMRVVGFLRAGYPEGVPAHDYIPLLALLAAAFPMTMSSPSPPS